MAGGGWLNRFPLRALLLCCVHRYYYNNASNPSPNSSGHFAYNYTEQDKYVSTYRSVAPSFFRPFCFLCLCYFGGAAQLLTDCRPDEQMRVRGEFGVRTCWTACWFWWKSFALDDAFTMVVLPSCVFCACVCMCA